MVVAPSPSSLTRMFVVATTQSRVREFFVTGTDTDVGKTSVACALLGAAAARGMTTAAMKPVETGCERRGEALWARDAARLHAASTLATALDDRVICPQRFEAPVAPSVAARELGVAVDLAAIASAWDRLRALGPELALVEGAGGLLVPIADDLAIADLVVQLGLPLVVVVRDRLGAINHARLTVEVARVRGISVAGVILNAVTAAECVAGNLDALVRAGVPVLGRLDASPSGAPSGAAVEAVLDRLLAHAP